jgi:hypothetical protein
MDDSDGQVEPMDQAALADRIQRMADVANLWLEDAEELGKGTAAADRCSTKQGD